MEPGYIKGDSSNLPVVDATMINNYFANNSEYISAEVKNVKSERAGRENYGDDAIGFIQIKRETSNAICTIKARITPEHRIHSKYYLVTAVIDEEQENILSCECHSCTASAGGCKHAVAVILWLHRRSEEPSVTSVTCYWKKSKLSAVGTRACTIQQMFSSGVLPLKIKTNTFLKKYIQEAKIHGSESLISEMYNENTCIKNISLHCLSVKYCKDVSEENRNAEDFITFCKNNITKEDCESIETLTMTQSKTSKWFDARYARITASKLYEVSRCQTFDGTLVETVFGARKIIQSEAMTRGQKLENAVIKEIEIQKNIKIRQCGLIIDSNAPIFGASPDGITDKYCIEVKCPSKEKTVENYITINNEVCKKPWAQIQLQMYLSGKKHGLFCVASPTFEVDKAIKIVAVNLEEDFCKEVMSKATDFWKLAIYPKLVN